MPRPNRIGYGLTDPLSKLAPLPILARRAPTTSDRGESGQQWINTNSSSPSYNDVWVFTTRAAGVSNWEPVGNDTEGGVSITKYVVDTNGGTGVDYTTIQSAITAAAAAGVDAVIYVRPGTYTENLTLVDGINIIGADVGSFGDIALVEIVGLHTPPASGSFAIRDCKLTSATYVFNSAVAGTTNIFVDHCTIEITNGYLFNLANWTGDLYMVNCGDTSTNNGVITNTGGSVFVAAMSTLGAGNGNTMTLSGNATIFNNIVNCPVSFAGTGTSVADAGNSFSGTITTAMTANVTLDDVRISTGATAAISHGSAGTLVLTNSTITSSNNPAIGGAGAGVMTLGSIDFVQNSAIAGTLTIAYSRATDRISPYIVGATGNYQTIQAALTAADDSGSDQTVIVQPGTYTEDLTLYDGIAIVGTSIQDTVIVGAHIPPASGTLLIQNCTLNSNTSILTSAVAGTTNIFIEQCFGAVTNGYIFDLANWTGDLAIDDCEILGTTNGVINNTGGSAFECSSVGFGAGAGAAVMSGACILEAVDFLCTLTVQGTGSLEAKAGMNFAGTLTTAGTATAEIDGCWFDTGATAAISHGSAGTLVLTNSTITSSNNPAIDGAGAGNVTLSGVEFTDNSNLAATLTLVHTAETRSTKLLCGDATYRVDDFTAESAIIQAYGDDDTASGPSAINAIRGNLTPTAGDGNNLPAAILGTCDAVAGANVLANTGVYGICDQTDGSVIASTAVGVEGEINIHETDAADLPQFYAFGVKGYYGVDDAAAVPITGEFAGIGSVVEYTTPLNAYGYGVVATRLGGGAGTAARAAFGVAQGSQAIADWQFAFDAYNTNTNAGVAYSIADVRFQNQSKLIVDTEGMTFTGDLATRSVTQTNTNIPVINTSPICQTAANTGGVPTGANTDLNYVQFQDGTVLEQYIIAAGGQTIIAPRMDATGLLMGLDVANSEGCEYNGGILSTNRHIYTIGTSPAFFIEASFTVATVAGAEPLVIGFRKVEANNATWTAYADYATIGIVTSQNAGTITIATEQTGGGTTYTNTTDAWTDGQTHTLRVNVSAAGVVTYLIDGVAPTSTAAYTFTGALEVTPMIHWVQAAGATSTLHGHSLKIGLQAWN